LAINLSPPTPHQASDGGIFAFNTPFAGSLSSLGLTDVAGIAT
jgi:hypothetical protein